jgi:cyclohexyl-isocyanide hydratase
MDRRYFAKASTATLFASLVRAHADAAEPNKATTATPPAADEAERAHYEAMQRTESFWGGKNVKIAFLVYPGMFLQDLVGPLTVFEALMNREIYLVWKDKETFGGRFLGPKPLIPVTPNMTFDDCPDDLDVLCVPGGVPGTFTIMEDDDVLKFLRDKGAKAKYITSVCTGSLVLGAAGLLKGYKATSHWITKDALKALGATPTAGRIVTDRNRITGGGVTAGIDFGLAIAAKLRNDAYAQAIQLYIEYDPQPPFDSGSPEKASKPVKAFLDDVFGSLRDKAQASAERAGKKLG